MDNNVAWMECNGIRENSAPFFLDSVALHPDYELSFDTPDTYLSR
ncbi:MAG: hypothetical protein ABW104_15045 [Candidatus Thiodiazotropha sp. 6PLUC2]